MRHIRVNFIIFEDFDLDSIIVVAEGTFSVIALLDFKPEEEWKSFSFPDEVKEQGTIVLKDPVSRTHDFVAEQYSLSHLVSCNLILHPNLLRIIGGIELNEAQRSGKSDGCECDDFILEWAC